jgi:hypothetical protein
MSLTSKAMLAKVSCSIIGQKKKDEHATFASNQHLQTSENAGHYQKTRISRENIIDVIRPRDAAMNLHRRMTTPFTSDHWGLISADLVMEYSKEMGIFKIQFEDAVVDVVNRWDAIVADEQKRLGPIFRADEYPDKSIVAEEFSFSHELKPVPDEGHIVVDLESEVLDDLRENLRKQNEKNLKRSVTDMWNRLFEPVNNMAEICLNDKKVFGSLLEKVEDIVDIIPSLNIIDDPHIADMADEIKNKLLVHTTGQIRDDKILKHKLGKDADDLAKNIRGFMDNLPKVS